MDAARKPNVANATTKAPESEELTDKERLKKVLEERPVRPAGLRKQLLQLYVLLVAFNLGFVLLAFSMSHPVPEGKFELEDGTLIDVNAFDPVALGPYPKCHPHHGEHMAADGTTWVKNDAVDVPSDETEAAAFPFPVGHPKNAEWVAKRTAREAESKLTPASLQPSLQLLLLSTTVMLLGCKHAVWMHAKPDSQRDGADDVERDEDVGQSALQDGDAYMFPVMGSAVLLGLFVVYKYLNADWIKLLFSLYVVVMCTNGLGINLGQVVALWFNSRGLGRFRTLFTVPYFDVRVTAIDIAAYAVSCALGVYYIQTKNWVINNVMGLSFCLLGIKYIGISSYKTGLIMLAGLMAYDLFFVFGSKSVFGSNVMVTVATGVEAPIKLVFPRGQDGCGNMMFSMLGLGDIVVPGLFIAFLAKYDLHRPAFGRTASYTFLNTVVASYALSLVTTVAVMLVFNHAQPALIYIVPFISATSFGLALGKGELSLLNAFVVEDTMIELSGESAPGSEGKKDK